MIHSLCQTDLPQSKAPGRQQSHPYGICQPQTRKKCGGIQRPQLFFRSILGNTSFVCICIIANKRWCILFRGKINALQHRQSPHRRASPTIAKSPSTFKSQLKFLLCTPQKGRRAHYPPRAIAEPTLPLYKQHRRQYPLKKGALRPGNA